MDKGNKWVIKAGSSLVSGVQEGINNTFINDLVKQVDYLLNRDQEVIIISSGAVAKGMHELGIEERPASLHLLQACAAVGQRGLIQIYQNALEPMGFKDASEKNTQGFDKYELKREFSIKLIFSLIITSR